VRQVGVDFPQKNRRTMSYGIKKKPNIHYPRCHERKQHNTMRLIYTRFIGFMLAMVFALGLTPTASFAQGDEAVEPLTGEQIRNLFLAADGLGGGVQLVDGRAQEYSADGSTIVAHYAVQNPVALGDLNDDDLNDAAMILQVLPTDGSPVIYSIHAIINNNGTAERVAFDVLGENLRVLNLAIREGEIVVDMVVHTEDDPDCCTTGLLRRVYKLQASGAFDLLVEMTMEEAELPYAFDDELTADELATLTYPETLDRFALDMVDGVYSFTHGENTFDYQLLADQTLYGDMTGDGRDDAVVFVQYSFNGEPAILHMYVVMNERGVPFIVGWRDYSRFVAIEITRVTINEAGILTVQFRDTVHDNLLEEVMAIEEEKLRTVR
jgi:hypothetical protein